LGHDAGVRATVVSDLDELAGLRPAWDDLAVASASPRSAPAPVLAWYRHVMEPEAAPRVLVAREGDRLTGVLPLIVYKPRFRPVNCTVAGMGMLNAVEPVGIPGTEHEVAIAFGEALSRIDPVPDTLRLGYMDRDSPWTPALQSAWPWRSTAKHVVDTTPRFAVHLADGYDAWLGRRSRHFRQHLRAYTRQIEAEGFEVVSTVEAAEIIPRLPRVIDQWNARRAVRLDGGTVFNDDVVTALTEIATEWSGTGRLWLTTIERAGQFMASGMVVGAGPVATFWITGFDATWSRLSPGTRLSAALVETAVGLGYDTFDLGLGDQSYKLRIADEEDEVEVFDFERRERRPLHSPLRLLSYGTRAGLKTRIKRSLGRDGGGGDGGPDSKGSPTVAA
jgi:CelD/BcsL family acetyltransferase involved in cellulose biosynthesis